MPPSTPANSTPAASEMDANGQPPSKKQKFTKKYTGALPKYQPRRRNVAPPSSKSQASPARSPQPATKPAPDQASLEKPTAPASSKPQAPPTRLSQPAQSAARKSSASDPLDSPAASKPLPPPARSSQAGGSGARKSWPPQKGDSVRALWRGDQEYHRATISEVIEVEQLYAVEYVTSSPSTDAKVTARVSWSNIKRPYNLPERPDVACDDDFEVGTKVLVKKSAGCWHPAIIEAFTREGTRLYDIKFIHGYGDYDVDADVPRERIERMYADSPLKYDENHQPVYPYTIEDAPEPVYGGALSGGRATFEPGPAPSKFFNYLGDKGYRKATIPTRDGDIIRAIGEWQNITMMKQTCGKAPMNSPTAIQAWYEAEGSWKEGTLRIRGLGSEVLATWSEGKQTLEFKTREVHSVWKQFKMLRGDWFMVRKVGPAGSDFTFCMDFMEKDKGLKIGKVLSGRLMAGRTLASAYTKYEGQEGAEGIEIDDVFEPVLEIDEQ